MYNTLLKSKNHHFDYIICPEPKVRVESVVYSFVKTTENKGKLVSRLINKNTKHQTYINALKEIIEPDCKYVIQVIDNNGLVCAIAKHLEKHFNRNDFYIQYCYHGFLPIENTLKAKRLFKVVDEIVFITAESYKAFLSAYDEITFKARVIHNGIDLKKFKTISDSEKQKLRSSHNILQESFVFIWCSHDRPKKGLHIIIDAFKELQKQSAIKIELLVIGIKREIDHPGITSIGHIPNDDIVKYYQMADVFLFPSLWQEGFGIVLAEALHCGCYTIASNRGGIKEVLEDGKYGVLIDKPNMVTEWVDAMQEAIRDCTENGNSFKGKLPKDLYSLKNWSEQLNTAILDAKEKLT